MRKQNGFGSQNHSSASDPVTLSKLPTVIFLINKMVMGGGNKNNMVCPKDRIQSTWHRSVAQKMLIAFSLFPTEDAHGQIEKALHVADFAINTDAD